jgi:hypothetical protein
MGDSGLRMLERSSRYGRQALPGLTMQSVPPAAPNHFDASRSPSPGVKQRASPIDTPFPPKDRRALWEFRKGRRKQDSPRLRRSVPHTVGPRPDYAACRRDLLAVPRGPKTGAGRVARTQTRILTIRAGSPGTPESSRPRARVFAPVARRSQRPAARLPIFHGPGSGEPLRLSAGSLLHRLRPSKAALWVLAER